LTTKLNLNWDKVALARKYAKSVAALSNGQQLALHPSELAGHKRNE
jgi:hypothetical protein